MSLRRYFGRADTPEAVRALYATSVRQARDPHFYSVLGVPDTLDGRFDLIALHVILLIRRLRALGPEGADLAQRLFDHMFDDMDINLREIGVSDLRVGKRVKQMARAFYGRAKAYDDGLAGDDSALADALRRNLFGTVVPAPAQVVAVARYVRREAATLKALGAPKLLEGDVRYGPPPAP